MFLTNILKTTPKKKKNPDQTPKCSNNPANNQPVTHKKQSHIKTKYSVNIYNEYNTILEILDTLHTSK